MVFLLCRSYRALSYTSQPLPKDCVTNRCYSVEDRGGVLKSLFLKHPGARCSQLAYSRFRRPPQSRVSEGLKKTLRPSWSRNPFYSLVCILNTKKTKPQPLRRKAPQIKITEWRGRFRLLFITSCFVCRLKKKAPAHKAPPVERWRLFILVNRCGFSLCDEPPQEG